MMFGMIITCDIFSIGGNASTCIRLVRRRPARARWEQLVAKLAIFYRGLVK